MIGDSRMPDVVVAAAGRRWKLPAVRVREVAALFSLTPIPMAPPAILGLTQLRGQILPVVDPTLGASDQAGARQPRPGDALLVVELGPMRAALLIDKVLGVGKDDPGALPLDVGKLFDQLRAGT